jgi:phosphoribosylformylglycinamidine cyclo-ligase
MTIGEAIISPTRHYSPIMNKILDTFGEYVTGLIHNTGGGQTKCLRVGQGIHYLKDKPLPVDQVFHLIKEESGENWVNMFQNYNMGTGFEIIVEKEVAEDILDIPHSYGCEAKIIGRCEKSQIGNRLTILTSFGSYQYP